MILGVVALVVDALTAPLAWSMQKGRVNIRALFLHNLSDALASVAVIVGGALILLYDIRWVDPAITIGIALYILWLAFSEIGKPIRILMLGSPTDIDTAAVIAALEGVDGIEKLRHTRCWQVNEHDAALDMRVVVAPERWDDVPWIRREARSLMEREFGIERSTIEFERADDRSEIAAPDRPDATTDDETGHRADDNTGGSHRYGHG